MFDEGNVIVSVDLKGRVDSTNADEVYNEIAAQLEGKEFDKIELRANDLEYISSAGLRSVMKLQKNFGKVFVTGASEEVYSIFDITGFTQIINVERAYKKYSLDGCKVIGKGAKGTVYRYDEDSVIKVYNDKNSIDTINMEIALAKKAFIAGIPTAISYGIVEVGDKIGTYFELINADSFSNLINEHPDKFDWYVGQMVDLLRQLHSTDAADLNLPSAAKSAHEWVGGGVLHVDEALADKINAMIDALPERNTMIHGDFHSNNVLMQAGEPILIDMDRVAYGHPIFELCGVYMCYIAFGEMDSQMAADFLLMNEPTRVAVWEKICLNYFNNKNEEQRQAIVDKIRLLTFVRLVRRYYKGGVNLSEQNQKNVDYCMNVINELLQRVDSFDFE